LLTHYQMPDAFGGIYSQPQAAVEARYPLPDGFDRNQLFMAQMQHFLKVAAGQVEPICTLEDGIRALEMAIAAKKSQVFQKRCNFIIHTLQDSLHRPARP
jgi:hypothetical protein